MKYFVLCPTIASSVFKVFQSKDVPEKSTTPEEFIRMTKGITVATAKAVAAGNSAQQEDVISTANLSRKAISDMLTTCKVFIHRRTHICPLTPNTISPHADQPYISNPQTIESQQNMFIYTHIVVLTQILHVQSMLFALFLNVIKH